MVYKFILEKKQAIILEEGSDSKYVKALIYLENKFETYGKYSKKVDGYVLTLPEAKQLFKKEQDKKILKWAINIGFIPRFKTKDKKLLLFPKAISYEIDKMILIEHETEIKKKRQLEIEKNKKIKDKLIENKPKMVIINTVILFVLFFSVSILYLITKNTQLKPALVILEILILLYTNYSIFSYKTNLITAKEKYLFLVSMLILTVLIALNGFLIGFI